MRNVSGKSCRENQNTFTFNNFFFPENRAVYEIMWKSMVQPDRPQMTIWRMRIACWIKKATETHSEHVIIIAFTRQQWLRERASMLRYTYITCLAIIWFCTMKVCAKTSTHFVLRVVRRFDPENRYKL
jgi:hypothetical protein